MTVAEVFAAANLSPHGRGPWGDPVGEFSAGIYVIARVNDATLDCDACAWQLVDQLPVTLDLEYERQRWLPNEPVIYIGKTDRTIHKRVGEFYDHKCGDKRPHAGGQVLLLLQCPLWVYWSPATDPRLSEQTMIRAFKERVGKEPFANSECGRRRQKRITPLTDPLTCRLS